MRSRPTITPIPDASMKSLFSLRMGRSAAPSPEPHPNCGYDSYFSIGEDGTVFHPTRDPVPCGFETCVCARHYWVGLLQ